MGSELRASFAWQAHYHLSHTLSPLLFIYFSNRVLHCPGPASDHDVPIYASHVVGIIDIYHHTQLVGGDEILLTFCLGWPQSVIF
jgi:hypothetical protein